MKLLRYFVAALAGIALSYVAGVFAMLGGAQFFYVIFSFLVLAHLASFVVAYKKATQGKESFATLALLSPAFVLWGGGMIFVLSISVFNYIKPAPANFVADCQTSEVQYLKLPANPVNSIAYDWEGKHGPNHVPPIFATFEFTERKHNPSHEGLPPNAPGPYVHFPKRGPFFGIETLTADVVVSYRFIHPEEFEKAEIDQESVGYDLTVTDRRDGSKIATLRYFIDKKNGNVCWPDKHSNFNEKTFLEKALGLNR